jgi:peptidoglycan/xylan/chitin deacetylase (PgdA/CDA1 family)
MEQLTSQTRRYPSPWRQLLRRLMGAILPRTWFFVRAPANSNAVCLTFDNGPHPEYTRRVLDVLKEHGVAGTFFVVGSEVEACPDLVRRMAAEGHAVGHHSYFHEPPHLTSARQLLAEVRRTCDLLDRLVGETPPLFRPPYGKLTVAKLWRLWWAGQTVVLWNVDPKDYACHSPEEVRSWFRRRPLRRGDVVLMHDNMPYAAEVLPEIIHAARARGLAFTTVSHWLT